MFAHHLEYSPVLIPWNIIQSKLKLKDYCFDTVKKIQQHNNGSRPKKYIGTMQLLGIAARRRYSLMKNQI